MDDGTPIELRVSIDEDKGSAVFDFEGTGDEVLGNVSGLAREETSVTFLKPRMFVQFNCPTSVTYRYASSSVKPRGLYTEKMQTRSSAIIYCLRAMVNMEVSLCPLRALSVTWHQLMSLLLSAFRYHSIKDAWYPSP